ncbi:MAG: hypothetical protein V4737_14365 [Curtobacterium sp.]
MTMLQSATLAAAATPQPGPWDLTLTLVVAGGAAILTAAGVVIAVVQRHRADARVQLWNRMQWMLSLAADPDDDARAIGMAAIEQLLDSDDHAGSAGPPVKLRKYDRRLLRHAARTVYQSGRSAT